MISVPAHDGVAPDRALESGLYWTIKQSFVAYVASTAGGTHWHSADVAVDATGTFRFPLSKAEPTADGWSLRFAGDVRFSGHFGMLFVAIIDPWLSIGGRGDASELSIADASAPDRRLTIATFDGAEPLPYGEHLVWPPLIPRLEPAGVELFGDAYARGAELDALKIAVRNPDMG